MRLQVARRRALQVLAAGTVSTNDFKNGLTVEIDGQPFRVMGVRLCRSNSCCRSWGVSGMHADHASTAYSQQMVSVRTAEFMHVKPGKGAAFVRSKLRNYVTGNTVERTFRAGEQVGVTPVALQCISPGPLRPC